jgi:hypothetical protein
MKPSRQKFWRKKSEHYDPFIASIMSRDRYHYIQRVFHANDNHLDIKADKLFKARPIIDLLERKFKELAPKDSHLVIDESLFFTRTRFLTFLSYMKEKPAKFGLKIYQSASSRSHFVNSFRIYTGSGHSYGQGDDPCTLSSEQVVLDLIRDFKTDGKVAVCFDNAFTSVALVELLEKMGIAAYGIIKANRQRIPVKFEEEMEKLEEGQFVWTRLRGTNVTLQGFFDSRKIIMVSNCHDPCDFVQRPQNWSRRRQKKVSTADQQINQT